MTTPVLVGAAAIMQRGIALEQSQDAAQLMIAACRQAATDAGSATLLARADWIGVPKGLWAYSDPARLIKEAVGNGHAKTVLADIGILQQTLLGQAAEAIARGEIHCAIVCGGEAKYRQLQAQIQGITLAETEQPECTPDIRLQPEAELWLDAETNAGLLMPVAWYALMESALRAAKGESVADNRRRISQRYAHFSEIAATNPHAWKREPLSAEQIAEPYGKNKMLAFPYTKAHNSEWNVDQASALILCSEKLADELGIARDQRIYPLASTESNHMQCLSERPQLHRQAGVEMALDAALTAAGIKAAQLSQRELYSCFPASVQMFADALGIANDDHELTVTGGMAQAGGPLNNYVLHATVRMIEQLRTHGGVGLISSVSGMLTKQAYGLWQREKPRQAFAFIDVSESVAATQLPKTVHDDYSGQATVAAITVLFQGELPSRAIAIVDTADGARAVAWSDDTTLMQSAMSEEWVGRTVAVADGRFSAV